MGGFEFQAQFDHLKSMRNTALVTEQEKEDRKRLRTKVNRVLLEI